MSAYVYDILDKYMAARALRGILGALVKKTNNSSERD